MDKLGVEPDKSQTVKQNKTPDLWVIHNPQNTQKSARNTDRFSKTRRRKLLASCSM